MEYAFAQLLMANGLLDEGVAVTAAVRDRYDGAKRNPWNEIECGSNYARSMASWGAVVLLAGFEADADCRPARLPSDRARRRPVVGLLWSGPPAYGTFELRDRRHHPRRPRRRDAHLPARSADGLGEPPTDVRVDGRSIPFESVGGDVVFEAVDARGRRAHRDRRDQASRSTASSRWRPSRMKSA